MMKFYTPREWHSLFDCPSLIIDDEGKIWSADNYYKILSGEPCGRIDYTGGKIYGSDLGYGMFAEPIAYLETKNGVTRVLDAKRGFSSAPILYIQNNKVYTPDQWTSIIDTPGGHIQKDTPSRKSSGGSAKSGISLMGELGLLAGIALFLLIGNGIEAMVRAPIFLVLAAVIFVTVLIIRKVSGGPQNILRPLSSLSNGMDPAKVSLCKVNAAICAGALFLTLMVIMVLCFTQNNGTSLAFATPLLSIMVIAIMAALYWVMYLSFRNAMLLGRIGCWPLRE